VKETNTGNSERKPQKFCSFIKTFQAGEGATQKWVSEDEEQQLTT
jgi:hypothetical protein